MPIKQKIGLLIGGGSDVSHGKEATSFWVLPTLQKDFIPDLWVVQTELVIGWKQERAARVRVCNFNRSDCAFFILLLNEANSNLIQAWLILAHFE